MSGTNTGQHSPELRQQTIELYNHCKSYMQASNAKAWWQLATTSAAFIVMMSLMIWFSESHYWISLLLAIPAGGLLTRFFALQHDCGHGSFFDNKQQNELVGRILSVLTFTPFNDWRNSHAVHHAGSGNLERRGIGDIETVTMREFSDMPAGAKWLYRIKRHPIIALLIGPPVYFLVLQRLPFSTVKRSNSWLPDNALHNLALLAFYGGLMWLFGWKLVLSLVLPPVLVGAWIGGFLFFVQHQFEETLWDGADKWDMKIAALLGSSHLQLNPVFNWFTCDIGLHHIHHLSSRIPNYRLRECMDASEPLQNIAPKLTLWGAFKSLHLALWDEEARRLISFREYFSRAAALA